MWEVPESFTAIAMCFALVKEVEAFASVVQHPYSFFPNP